MVLFARGTGLHEAQSTFVSLSSLARSRAVVNGPGLAIRYKVLVHKDIAYAFWARVLFSGACELKLSVIRWKWRGGNVYSIEAQASFSPMENIKTFLSNTPT